MITVSMPEIIFPATLCQSVEASIGAHCNQTVSGHRHYVSNCYAARRTAMSPCYADAAARSPANL